MSRTKKAISKNQEPSDDFRSPSDSKRVKVAVTLPGSRVAFFDQFAKRQGISRSEAIDQAMSEFVKNHDPLLKLLAEAPEDDEPFSDEEKAMVHQSLEEIARGEYYTAEEIEREVFGS